jgi:predicted lipid-binding transport protein (Tim44 family)
MKRFVIALFVALVGGGMIAADAEAKRLGGGKSSGITRDNVMKRDAAPAQPAAPAQSTAPAPAQPAGAAAAQPNRSGLWGMLGGLALGAGLASLFAGGGFGGMLTAILVGLLLLVGVMFLVRMFRSKQGSPAAPMQYAGAGAGNAAPRVMSQPPLPGSTAAALEGAPRSEPQSHVPAGFDVDGFLRHAKLNFLRLQAANDAGNLEDIREFTTPEMFAEIKLQMQERGSKAQETDVMALNADLLDASEEGERYLASVRFYGTIREVAGAAPEAFDEVWHLAKPRDSKTGWAVAGIQQRN